MYVVDHQPQPLFQRREIVKQPLHQRPPVQVRCRRHRPHQFSPRARRPQGADHRQPERLRIPHTPPRVHPCHAPREARLADPRLQQHRLPAARGPGHHAYPGRPTEPTEQPPARHHPVRATASPAPDRGLRPRSRLHSDDNLTAPPVTAVARHVIRTEGPGKVRRSGCPLASSARLYLTQIARYAATHCPPMLLSWKHAGVPQPGRNVMGKIALEEHVVRYRQEHIDRWHTTGAEEDQPASSRPLRHPSGRRRAEDRVGNCQPACLVR